MNIQKVTYALVFNQIDDTTIHLQSTINEQERILGTDFLSKISAFIPNP